MWFSLSDQTLYFIASVALGAALAAVYDLVRAARMLLRAGRVHVFLSDVAFFAVCGAVTSLFALPFNKGDVRAFVLFGEALGFLMYRLTIGSVMGRFYAGIARILRRFIGKICEFLKNIFDLLLKAGSFLVYNVHEIIDKTRDVMNRWLRRRRADRGKKQKGSIYERKANKKKKKRGNARGRRRRRER